LLLVCGCGLLSVPIAAILGCLLARHFLRRACLAALGPAPADAVKSSSLRLLALLWPNSWRVGVQLLSEYLRNNAFTAICVATFGLAANAQYGLSLQVMSLATGMASVWTTVKLPEMGRLRSAGNLAAMRTLLWPRFWLQGLTFLLLAGAAIGLGPFLLHLIRTDKTMLAAPVLGLLALNALLDLGVSLWGTLLTLENRVPTLWPIAITSVLSVGLALGLAKGTQLGVLSLVVTPLATGLVFNYWYWPLAGARSLQTTLTRFLFRRAKRCE
jgi:hypothetical protein